MFVGCLAFVMDSLCDAGVYVFYWFICFYLSSCCFPFHLFHLFLIYFRGNRDQSKDVIILTIMKAFPSLWINTYLYFCYLFVLFMFLLVYFMCYVFFLLFGLVVPLFLYVCYLFVCHTSYSFLCYFMYAFIFFCCFIWFIYVYLLFSIVCFITFHFFIFGAVVITAHILSFLTIMETFHCSWINTYFICVIYLFHLFLLLLILYCLLFFFYYCYYLFSLFYMCVFHVLSCFLFT